MKKFMGDNYLLNNEIAVELYHDYSKNMPIFDYHSHLSSKEISENKLYENITEIWLGEDHYKWRALRSNGIEEAYITGNASDYEKFSKWTKTVPYLIGNPLYNWSHLELKRFFKLKTLINEENSDEIWKETNRLLKTENFRVKNLIKKANVKILCTTDDPIDDLKYHKKIKEDKNFGVKVLPTFRADKALNIDHSGFIEWVEELITVNKKKIIDYEDFCNALKHRLYFFNKNGCKISDHSIEDMFFCLAEKEELNKILKRGRSGKKLSKIEVEKFKTMTLINLAKEYSKLNWTMQLHIGALRNNNTRMFKRIGSDSGFDSINDGLIAKKLSRLLDTINIKFSLPKTVLYCLNPSYNYIIGTMIGNFQEAGVVGKMQFGPSWWFNDQKEGIKKQIKDLSSLGILSRFIGMVTDSRSFLSYTRHEYFRRILCDIIGTWVINGEVPYDIKHLGSMVKNISYNNAVDYFGIDI